MTCEDLQAFVDGELGAGEAGAYRKHLAGCASCQAELPGAVALAERLAGLRAPSSGTRTAAPAAPAPAADDGPRFLRDLGPASPPSPTVRPEPASPSGRPERGASASESAVEGPHLVEPSVEGPRPVQPAPASLVEPAASPTVRPEPASPSGRPERGASASEPAVEGPHLVEPSVEGPRPVEPAARDAAVPSLAAARRLRARRRTIALAAGALGLAAAAVLVVGLLRANRAAPPRPPAELLAEGGKRPTLARFTYPGAAAYRPYDPERGASGAAAVTPVPMDALAALERARDWHGLAVATFLNGDRARAEAYLADARPSDDVAVDRAAMALGGDGAPSSLAPALATLDDVLRRAPGHAAARWNRAQLLARLGLARTAAAAFEALAREGEAGWSDEAARTAAALRATIASEQDGWSEDWKAGTALVADGTLPAPGRAAARPGIFRLMVYDAVRAAPTAERVRALRAIAIELDAPTGAGALTAYVDHVAALPAEAFAVRAPLAARYRALAVDNATLAPAAVDAYLAALRKAGPAADDIRLGTIVRLGLAARERAELDALVTAARDPWFHALAAHEQGKAALASGDHLAAEAALVAGLRTARDGRVDYRAEVIELDLARLYLQLERLPDAAAAAESGFARARAGGEASHATSMLPVLGQIALHRFQLALAAAYFREEDAAAPDDDCATHHHARVMLAEALALAGAHDDARAALFGSQPCPGAGPDLAQLWLGVVLWRHGGGDPEADELAASLDAATAAAGDDAGAAITLAALAGALDVERKDAALATRGRERLQAVIAHADAALLEPDAPARVRQVRGWAHALLAIDAARRHDDQAVLALTAGEKGVPVPTRCALAVVIEDERRVAAAIGPSGATALELDLAWPRPNAAAPDGTTVPASVTAALAGCDEVAVLAQPPVEGTPRLLPPDVAWWYQRPPSGVKPEPLRPRRVLLSGVIAPDRLALPPLPPAEAPTGGDVIDLRGASATPSRLLAAMPGATEIELHTHGLQGGGGSDASYLVLSPESNGDHALTAARVAALRLRAGPLVTLAACGSARGEPYLHQADSLPAAFIRAGARAVLATADDIPDEEAARFFAAVRARVTAGARLPAALRDERKAWLDRDPRSWTGDVLLFQ